MMNFRHIILSAALAVSALGATAQVENAGGVRKRTERDKTEQQSGPKVSQRMQGFFESKEPHDADIQYMRQIYRQLDLTKPANTPLYYPEDVVDGQENLFRIMLGLVVNGSIPAYEYLDGREVFSDRYKINVADMLERFGIYATEAKGSTEKNPKFTIEEADVPTAQVLNYYIIEKWEFDRRSNRMKTRVEAICPVLNRSGDFGGDARYPMFWVKFDALRPYLAQQYVFLNDDNNLANYSIDDYFNLGMYDGEIYKTRNLRNLSMAQMFPDEDDMKRAQDSIDNRLRNYGKDLFVPTREQYLAMREKEETGAAPEADIPERKAAAPEAVTEVSETVPEGETAVEPVKKTTTRKRAAKKSDSGKPTAKTASKSTAKSKTKSTVKSSSSSSGASAAKSVRRRKR